MMENVKKDIVFRDAKIEDCDMLHRLIKESVESTNITIQQLKDDGFGSCPRFGAIIIECDQQMIGFSIYTWKYSTWKGRILWIDYMYIQENYRNIESYHGLMRSLATKAAETDMDRIQWDGEPPDSMVKDFYQSIGVIDLTNDEQWLVYQFEAEQYRKYLAKPFTRTESIKIE